MADLDGIINWCEQGAHSAKEGNTNALDVFAELRAIKAAAEDALKEVEPLAMEEAQRYHEKTFEHGGLKFTRTDGKRSFKYDHLKEWADASKALKAIEERAKNAALQAEKKLMVAGEDGEVFEPAIVTYGKPSLSIAKG